MIVTNNDIKSINTALLSLQDEIASLKKQLSSLEGKTESIQNLTNYNKEKNSDNRSSTNDLSGRIRVIDAGAYSGFVGAESPHYTPFNVNEDGDGGDTGYALALYNNKVDKYGYNNNGLTEYADNLVRTGTSDGIDETNPVDTCVIGNGIHNAVAVGKGTIAGQSNTMVLGTYNVHDEDLKDGEERAHHALVVGNGTGTKEDERSNAFAVDQNGDIRVRGEIYYGCEPDSSGGKTIGDNIEVINRTISNLGDTYLPLSGGAMEDKAWIKFQENDDDTSGGIEIEKAKLYSSDGEFFIDSEGEIELKGTNIDINASTRLTLSGEGSVGIECDGDINMYPGDEVGISGNLTVTNYTNCNKLEAVDGNFTGSLVIPTGAPKSLRQGCIWMVK